MQKHASLLLFPLLLSLTGSSTAFFDTTPPVAAVRDSGQHAAYLSGSDEPLPAFLPNAALTRAQAAQLLHALLAGPTTITISYADIPDGAWYAQAAQAMGSLGVMRENETEFLPDEPLTRAEFTRCLSCFFPPRTDAESFSDVPDDHEAAAAIRSAKAYGWVQGDDENRFRPDDPITRVEAVVMLNRALNRVPDQAYIDRTKPAFYRDVTPANWYYYEIMEASVPHTCRTPGGKELWASHTPAGNTPNNGFYLIGEQLYYYDSTKQDILRGETYEGFGFSASGQLITDSARLTKKAKEFAAERSGLTLSEMEQLLSEAAAAEEWCMILINHDNPLPEDFTIPELTALDNGYQIDSRVYPALQSMLADARAAGYSPMVCSAYRSREKQTSLHQRRMVYYLNRGYSREDASEAASFWVAKPDTSEHQAGLAADIVDSSYPVLNKSQENRPVQKWLMEHCAEYGFILRYPTSKSSLTMVGYEPWHYRYVGIEAAQEIMSRGICLEEYLNGN